MLQKLLKNRKESGFTIIEVMIVLAIAGLILVVVLIAVPQLQRNQRNEARRSIASRIATEIANYQGNNNGNLPVAATAAGATNFGSPLQGTSFFGRYLQCSGASPAVCTVNINDPRTSFPVGTGSNGQTLQIATSGAGPATGTGSEGALFYATGFICDGENPTTSNATGRNYALAIRLEGGASYCIDNQ